MPTTINGANAASAGSTGWFYPDWQYRKAHDLTAAQTNLSFYTISDPYVTLLANTNQHHSFQPVHTDAIVEVDKSVDGKVWKYLAYDSDVYGSQIRLYYTNDTSGTWTAYTQNPIIGTKANYYRWPSTIYTNGVFNMFLEDRSNCTLERWTSTDGIHFIYIENIKAGGSEYKNPFIWFNVNDNKWYLYSHDFISPGAGESIKVRSATSLDGLKSASDTIVLSKNIFYGSPTIMFYNGLYWLLIEVAQGIQWHVQAFYSTSPTSGFTETCNSPIIATDESCPMLFLTPDKTRALLFTIANGSLSQWYLCRHEIYLNSSNQPQLGDLKDYQTRIVVNFGNGISSGDSVYLFGHCQLDFSDVRFTWLNALSLSEVECSYWIEQATNGSNAVFWVKIPQISATTNSTIYIYYGKTGALTTSNGSSTFEFFDDFSGDLSKWTAVGGSWQIQNGELAASTTGSGQLLRANGFVFGNDVVHVSVKWVAGTIFESGPCIRGQTPNEQNNGFIAIASAYGDPSTQNHNRIMIKNNGAIANASQGATLPAKNVWYTYVFKAYGNRLSSSIFPLYSTDLLTANDAFTSGSLSLYSWATTAESVHYDNIYVTKYSSPEPIQTSWYGEEAFSNWTPPPTPTPTLQPTDLSPATPMPTPSQTQIQSQLTVSAPAHTKSPLQPSPTNTPSPLPSQSPSSTNNPVDKASPEPEKSAGIPPEILPMGVVIAVILAFSALTIVEKQQSHKKFQENARNMNA